MRVGLVQDLAAIVTNAHIEAKEKLKEGGK